MNSRRTFLAGQILLLSSALCLVTAAVASLKAQPPKGVVLSGTWQIDPYRSDDPAAVLDQAREGMHKSSGGGRHRGGMNRGVFGGGDSGGNSPGGYPGGHRRGGGYPGTGGGGWGSGDDDGSSPSGGSSGGPSPASSHSQGPRGELFTELEKNPEKLGFLVLDRNLKVTADQADTECAGGVKVAISDAQGDGERSCGWDGRAWVIETTRGKSLTRTDRYEMSKDGKTLTYVTTASGSRVPKIKISRTYTVAAAAPPGAPLPSTADTATNGVTH